MIQFFFLFMMLGFGLADQRFFLAQKSSGLINYFIFLLTTKVFENAEDTSKLCFNNLSINFY